jgi:hypothetical protein
MKRHSMSYITSGHGASVQSIQSWFKQQLPYHLPDPLIENIAEGYENLEHKKWLLCKNISRSKDTPTT